MIEVKNLTQIYKSGKGVFDLNFTIKEGEVFGYIGPNGAGKTTTIRNLLGFANPTKGNAVINGINCRKEAAKLQNTIGYLPGEITFFENMKGMEFLRFMCEMRHTKDLSRRDELIELFELDTKGKIKKMSKGMKQKLGIVTAFMHDPSIYILDEPTSGLDPLMQNLFMNLLDREKERGKTIMMSSHIFEEVQRVCDRAGIIKDGRIVAVEDVQSLNAMKQETFIIRLSNKNDVSKLMNNKLDVKKITDKKVKITVNNNYKEFFKILSDCSVIGLEAEQQSLENVFMKYYGKDGVTHE
ncbi:ABC transporter ATP-binding protein [Vallitalea guaymasensis]|uniref:ABC transporter ATP-binding protein n=1 Tax=Vallitalea guaymasensis TaxID=1185412 RepID=UPI00272A97F1|nr:ABC transporter ATP-binding protein [Vallitalea guaymasensis]